MPQSYSNRFSTREVRDEIRDMAILRGLSATADEFKVTCSPAWERFVEGLVGHPVPYITKLEQSDGPTVGDYLLEAFERRVARLEAEKRELIKTVNHQQEMLKAKEHRLKVNAVTLMRKLGEMGMVQ